VTARAAPAWWGNAGFLTSLVFLLAAWQLSGLFLNKIFIATPIAVGAAFAEILFDGTLIRKFADSALDMGVGFGIAAVVGIGCGVIMGRSARAERAFEPIVNFANATPTIALLPLMEIWFGLGMAARVSFIVIICVWTLLIKHAHRHQERPGRPSGRCTLVRPLPVPSDPSGLYPGGDAVHPRRHADRARAGGSRDDPERTGDR